MSGKSQLNTLHKPSIRVFLHAYDDMLFEAPMIEDHIPVVGEHMRIYVAQWAKEKYPAEFTNEAGLTRTFKVENVRKDYLLLEVGASIMRVNVIVSEVVKD